MLVTRDAEVIGQLQLGAVRPGHAEEVVDRLVADRQLAPLLEPERLVEGDRLLGIADAVAGVNELHAGILRFGLELVGEEAEPDGVHPLAMRASRRGA